MSEAAVLLGVMAEAMEKFGPPTQANKAAVTAYVTGRMREIKSGVRVPTEYQPRGFDAKARAARSDD